MWCNNTTAKEGGYIRIKLSYPSSGIGIHEYIEYTRFVCVRRYHNKIPTPPSFIYTTPQVSLLRNITKTKPAHNFPASHHQNFPLQNATSYAASNYPAWYTPPNNKGIESFVLFSSPALHLLHRCRRRCRRCHHLFPPLPILEALAGYWLAGPSSTSCMGCSWSMELAEIVAMVVWCADRRRWTGETKKLVLVRR